MKYLISVAFLLFSLSAAAQQAIDFETARKSGQFSRLEKEYSNALEIFKTEEDSNKLMESWKRFFADLGEFLSEKGYKWKEQTRCFNRIYMSPDGTIDFFLYHFKTLGPEKEKLFNQLLQEYITTHNFGIASTVKFAQCGNIVYSSQ